jgi:uncharacterized membrane protein YbhN (UPF0104 family)
VSASRLPKIGLKLVAYAIVAVAFGYFLHALYSRLDDIPPIHWNARAVAAAVLSVLGIVFTILVTGYLWRALLKDHGVRLHPGKAMQIMAISQFGKYLPGNIGHFAGRAALGKAAGVPISVTVNTVLVDILWHLAIGFAFAALAVLTQSSVVADHMPDGLEAPHMAVITVALLFLPWVGITLLNRWLPQLSRRLGGGQLIAPPTLKTAVVVGLLILLGLHTLGAILKMQAVWLFGVTAGSYYTLTILYVASWVIGYVVPGSPGGVGVREAMVILLLGPVVGPGAAVGLSISMRLANMLGDGVAFLLGLLSRRWL